MNAGRWRLTILALLAGLLPEAMIAHVLVSSHGWANALLARDFSTFWGSGWLILHGGTGIIFHPAQIDLWLHQRFPFLQDARLWSYPPGMGLLMAPLGLLPPLAAWFLWLAGGIAALIPALRIATGGRTLALTCLVLAMPVFWDNLLVGQNALYTGALTIAGFGLLGRRPTLAGIAFGLLTMKPQLGLLVPVAMVAARAWRSLGAAAVTALALAALAAWAMPGSWPMFFADVAPAMNARLLQPYLPTPTQAYMASAFITAQGLSLPQAAAMIIQGIVSLAAAVAMWRLWRAPADGQHARCRMAASAGLCLAATPFSLDYDAVGATALLCGLLLEDGATLSARRFTLALIALAQPGWSLCLAVCLHAPVFPWIAWLLFGLTSAGSSARLGFEPVGAGAGRLHIERQPVREWREGA